MTVISELRHPSHPHTLHLRLDATPYACDGCKELGLHARYTCEQCDFHLHKECVRAANDPQITHAFFHECVFSFLEKPQSPERICDACGRDIKGYNYHCSDKGLDLHPCCAKLPFEMVQGEVKLKLRQQVSSRCYKCRRNKYRNEKNGGWSYVSAKGDVHLHIACVTEMLLENWERECLGCETRGKASDGMELVGTEMPKLHIVLDKGNEKFSGKSVNYRKIAKIAIASIIGAMFGDLTAVVLAFFTSTSSG